MFSLQSRIYIGTLVLVVFFSPSLLPLLSPPPQEKERDEAAGSREGERESNFSSVLPPSASFIFLLSGGLNGGRRGALNVGSTGVPPASPSDREGRRRQSFGGSALLQYIPPTEPCRNNSSPSSRPSQRQPRPCRQAFLPLPRSPLHYFLPFLPLFRAMSPSPRRQLAVNSKSGGGGEEGGANSEGRGRRPSKSDVTKKRSRGGGGGQLSCYLVALYTWLSASERRSRQGQ